MNSIAEIMTQNYLKATIKIKSLENVCFPLASLIQKV